MGDGEPVHVSRRDFLKVGATAIAGGATTYAAMKLGIKPNESEQAPSPETLLKPTAIVLDFFKLDAFEEEYIRHTFPPGFSAEKNWLEMGVKDPTTLPGLLHGIPKNEDQAKLLLMKLFSLRYQTHAENVISVMSQTASYVGFNQESVSPNRVSLTPAVSLGALTYDELGNPTVSVTLSSPEADRLIAHAPQSVVNLSLEFGDFPVTYVIYEKKPKYPEMARQSPSRATIGDVTTYKDYQGHTITPAQYDEITHKMGEMEVVLRPPQERDVVFLDGYAGEKTYENLQQLAKMAGNHPHKICIAAGGNPTYHQGLHLPDIREARLKLESQGLWPDNLLMIGFQTRESGFVGPASYGADIYVSDEDLEKLGLSSASSNAAPLITEITRQLISEGINTPRRIKAALSQMTRTIEFYQDSTKTEYNLLDLDRVKNRVGFPPN